MNSVQMMNFDDAKVKEFICNETSEFALGIIDIESSEVIYRNSAMQKIMHKKDAKKCWESIYGLDAVCSWCQLKHKDDMTQQSLDSSSDKEEFEYEYFSEMTSRWYQVQNRVTVLNSKKILIMIALDISRQKKAQGDLISTQFRLAKQTQELQKAQDELKVLASTDSMTKLYNRRYFMEVSDSLLLLAKREARAISLMMLDIDKFKNINDIYGHKIGDEVIIKLSQLLQENSRKSDIVCRWGGEEFIILLPNTEIEGATTIAQKIREVVDSLSIPIKEEEAIHFSVSIGVSQFDSNSEINLEATINRADEALYEAKNSGRNRVCVAPYL